MHGAPASIGFNFAAEAPLLHPLPADRITGMLCLVLRIGLSVDASLAMVAAQEGGHRAHDVLVGQ
ncbi:hypothetical protein [Micromonospora endophytica]|uniref:hypothetical protein n=1 Tax=Micromonospora endophytica TaxID=515350 RepID=UPI0015E8E27E|nr:hypothetical protein [Micromonospora endophytica]